MSKITSNIEELKKIINEVPFNQELAFEFLEAIEENAINIQDELDDLEREYRDQDNIIENLRDEVQELENTPTNASIEAGIGIINYEEPDNLQLQDVMENLETAIKKTSPNKVSAHLSML